MINHDPMRMKQYYYLPFSMHEILHIEWLNLVSNVPGCIQIVNQSSEKYNLHILLHWSILYVASSLFGTNNASIHFSRSRFVIRKLYTNR